MCLQSTRGVNEAQNINLAITQKHINCVVQSEAEGISITGVIQILRLICI